MTGYDETEPPQAAAPDDELAGPVRVPHERLSPETLQELVEHFVTREGTDYGVREFSLAEKCAHVMTQLRSGKAFITFDPTSDSCTIILK